jgi:hypothetical protein
MNDGSLSTILTVMLLIFSIVGGVIVARGYRKLMTRLNRRGRRRAIEHVMRTAVEDAEDEQMIARKLLREYEG